MALLNKPRSIQCVLDIVVRERLVEIKYKTFLEEFAIWFRK